MQTIYDYNIDEFNKSNIISKMNDIGDRIHEEREKDNEEYNKEREKELLYAQFIQGLKLSIK